MSKWLTVFLCLLPIAAQAAEGGRKTVHFDLPCGSKKANIQYSVPFGTELEVRLHRPEKCSDGVVTNGLLGGFRPAVRADFGVGARGITLGFNAEVAFGLTDSLELIGQVNGNVAEGRSYGTGFSGGIGGWTSDQWRLSGFVAGATSRNSSWNYLDAGPYGALQADFVSAGRKIGGLDVGLRIYAGPSWDQADRLSSQWGVNLMFGWMSGH